MLCLHTMVSSKRVITHAHLYNHAHAMRSDPSRRITYSGEEACMCVRVFGSAWCSCRIRLNTCGEQQDHSEGTAARASTPSQRRKHSQSTRQGRQGHPSTTRQAPSAQAPSAKRQLAPTSTPVQVTHDRAQVPRSNPARCGKVSR